MFKAQVHPRFCCSVSCNHSFRWRRYQVQEQTGGRLSAAANEWPASYHSHVATSCRSYVVSSWQAGWAPGGSTAACAAAAAHSTHQHTNCRAHGNGAAARVAPLCSWRASLASQPSALQHKQCGQSVVAPLRCQKQALHPTTSSPCCSTTQLRYTLMEMDPLEGSLGEVSSWRMQAACGSCCAQHTRATLTGPAACQHARMMKRQSFLPAPESSS